MIKYRVELSRWRVIPSIDPHEVVKETAKQLVILTTIRRFNSDTVTTREDRCNKESEYHCFFDTWDAAHEFLIAEAQRKVESAQRTLEEAKTYQGNVKGMKKPE